jgi:hypothetical protein
VRIDNPIHEVDGVEKPVEMGMAEMKKEIGPPVLYELPGGSPDNEATRRPS